MVKNKLLVCTTVAISVASSAIGCLWYQGTTIDGRLGIHNVNIPGSPKALSLAIKMKPANEEVLFKAHEYAPANPVAKKNDKAVQVLLRGDATKAVNMLNNIERENPGHYFTAANLGTAYELAGDDENALKWIKEGIRRDPDSHMSTEWLHVRILEAKIQLKAETDWLTSRTITGADYGETRREGYYIETSQGNMNSQQIWNSLYRQLSVRILFVKPQDRVVAQLLKELALCEAQLGILENADGYARLAVHYGLPIEELKNTVLNWREIIKSAGGM